MELCWALRTQHHPIHLYVFLLSTFSFILRFLPSTSHQLIVFFIRHFSSLMKTLNIKVSNLAEHQFHTIITHTDEVTIEQLEIRLLAVLLSLYVNTKLYFLLTFVKRKRQLEQLFSIHFIFILFHFYDFK